MEYDLTQGLAVDVSHSMKNNRTEYQGVDLATGEVIFYKDLGQNQSINIGEFLAIVEGIKYIMDNDYQPRRIFSDSTTAIAWIRNKHTSSKRGNKLLQKAEIYLKVTAAFIDDIEIVHWDNKNWGETPADFNRK